MFVYDTKSQQLMFQETNVVSAAWNLEMEDMLAYTSKDTLFIRTGNMPPSQQKLIVQGSNPSSLSVPIGFTVLPPDTE